LFTGVYASVTEFGVTSSVSFAAAAGNGFLAAGILTAAFALAGLILAVRIGRYARSVAAIKTEESTQTFHLAEIMKTDVYALSPDDSVLDAWQLFANKHISGAPIINDNGEAIGFLSDGDIMRHLADQIPVFKNAWSIMVEQGNGDFDAQLRDVMQLSALEIATRHVISVDVNASIGAICKTMVDHHLRKSPVVQDGKVVGIINRSNISHYSINTYLATIAR
jgi:DHA2 family lincomycin resistance protein-like MFS transporter